MKNILKRLGRNIKKTRCQLQLTQKELAEKSEITFTHIWRLENNISFPRLDTLLKISKGLDIKLEKLIEGIDQ